MTKVSNKEQSNNINVLLANNLPPSELIALKEYYDKKLDGANRYRSKEQIDAEIISENIEKRLNEIAAIFR